MKRNNIFDMSGNYEKLHSLFYIFPVGMMVFERFLNNNETDFELKYINDTALKIFGKGRATSKSKEEEIKDMLKRFNLLKNFRTLNEVYLEMKDESQENLYNRIFHSNLVTEDQNETCEKYISKEIMIYVKIKTYQDYKLVSIENFNDERIAIQNNIIKNIKTQYLLTLSHELNNPLNSLTHSVNEIISTKEEKKENKKFLNAMKINIRLIKFFIKNFIFSLKMSFDKNTIKNLDKADEERLKENCLNLEYIFKMVNKKYSIFYIHKKISLDCNFNQMDNINVTYDYDYFKSLIKNIFMYLFYRVDRNGGFLIEFEFEKELKILFKKNINKGNYMDHRTLRKSSQLDTSFVSEINIESSVKTLKILNEIINKFAEILGIRLRIFEDESPCYLILYLKYEIEEDLSRISQELAEEFTYRDSKRKNTNLLNRSISAIFQDTISVLNKSELKQSRNKLTNGKNENVCDYSISILNDSSNISNISYTTNNQIKQESIVNDVDLKSSEKTKKKNRKFKSSKSPLKINRYMTSINNLKKSVTFNSDIDSENDNEIKASTNAKPKKVFLRSNFTFKYTNKSSEDEVDLKVDFVLDNPIENFKHKQISSNPKIHSRSNDLNSDIVKSKLRSANTITINNNMNSINNNYSNVNSINKESNNSAGSSKGSLENKTKLITKDSLSNKKENFQPSKFKENFKKVSPIRKNTKTSLENFNKTVQSKTNNTSSNNNKLSVSSINPLLQSLHSIQSVESSESRATDILVVDDDNFNLNVLQSMLKKLKLKSDTCMNGLECVRKLQNKYSKGGEYKLIFMDVMMPILDGIQASVKIEELVKNNKMNKNLKIIIISAHNDQEIVGKATKLSVVKEFLAKPVKQGDIQRIISSYYL